MKKIIFIVLSIILLIFSIISCKKSSDKMTDTIGISTPTAQALVGTIKNFPVIFTAVTDPVGAGLISSLDKGENNITGISDMTPVKEQIEFLMKIKEIKKLGHVYTSSEANAVKLAEIAKKSCEELGIEFVETTVTNSAEVKRSE